MGGGSSALREMDEIVTCTYLLGRAIAAMSFPDMYRIQDFHSKKAPELKSDKIPPAFARMGLAMHENDDDDPTLEDGDGAALLTGGNEGDGEGGGGGGGGKTQAQLDEEEEASFPYGDHFMVIVGEDKVVIDDIGQVNDDGWTPLHGCCHSHTTVSAGLKIIQEMQRTNTTFEQKTVKGPGAHNAEWTALHMACAYGVEPLALQLITAGASVNCENSLSWTPLHEACHRGFISIARALVAGKASMTHVPDEESNKRFPFSRPPPQSPLAEAARCGFKEIVKMLLDSGAEKDLANHMGWTSLHEAAFYNHIDVVKVLLVYGADATIKNKQGAMPWQLASMQLIRDLIKDMGGPEAVPDPNKTKTFVFKGSGSGGGG
eukprot:CAMPEP_0182557106 /NCGR_PEP_ID=MMETSP1324-20130603/1149_1 /TAXON_ID=236786 /ORGANISM="Florenciella sp., Strain RCC1587" /LENGTH=374 /DNA_ID=CAMNT_0024769117 /DNA_START=16 /DNA_END=1136 /DNA_ORIENTATION=+